MIPTYISWHITTRVRMCADAVNHFCLFTFPSSIPFRLRLGGRGEATFFCHSVNDDDGKRKTQSTSCLPTAVKCHAAYTILCYAITTMMRQSDWVENVLNINHLTSYHLSIAANLKCNRHTGIHVEKYDKLMWLRTLWVSWTVVLMLKPWPKMKYRLNDGPWTRISWNGNRCCLGIFQRYLPKMKIKTT